jgi:hypothetical protein
MVEQTDKNFTPQQDNDNAVKNNSWAGALPVKQGLYDPELEKDSCGVGFTWYLTSPSSGMFVRLLIDLVTSKARRVIRLLQMVSSLRMGYIILTLSVCSSQLVV